MNNKRGIGTAVAALAIVIALALAVVGLRAPGTPVARPGPDVAANPAAATADAQATGKTTPPQDPRHLPPLPPRGTPLAAMLPELERRAAAGESPAACRLAAELSTCRGVQAARDEHARWLAERRTALELSSAGRDAAAVETFNRVFEQELAMREQRLQALERHCDRVQAPTGAELALRWQHAARLGDPAAMRHYASGRAFGWGTIIETAPLLPQYQLEAETMARERVRAGDLAMTLQLAAATAPFASRTHSLLGQVVDEDLALSVALYRRALSALETEDSHNARRVATDIRGQLDLLEERLAPGDSDQARALEAEMRDWAPVQTDGLHRRTSAHGIGSSGEAWECPGAAPAERAP